MARVVIRGEALAAFLRSPSEPVGRTLIALATEVQTLAKAQVGYDTRKPAGSEGGAHLRDTIVKRIVQEGNGIAVYVGSSHPIALMHHEGTRPHEIRPNKAQVLAFEMDGQVIFATVVHHPGTAPNRYLSDSLEKVMANFNARSAA